MGYMEQRHIDKLKEQKPSEKGYLCSSCGYYQWIMLCTDTGVGNGRCLHSYKYVDAIDYCDNFKNREPYSGGK